MAKLGYTWYPKDWGNSDSVFELNLSERGMYRELIDLAMLNDNNVEVKKDVWERKFAVSNIELEDILNKLIRLNLIVINDNILNVPSCESRLQLSRGGREGGKKSKPTTKPIAKPFESLCENNEKPIAKQIEKKDKIKESNIEATPKHKTIIWLEKNCPSVQKMKKPITKEEAEKIAYDYKDHKELVMETFLSMENKPDLVKKYSSAYLTFLNWIKRSHTPISKTSSQKWTDPSQADPHDPDFLDKAPKNPYNHFTHKEEHERFRFEWKYDHYYALQTKVEF